MSPVDRDELLELAQLELLGVLDDTDALRLESLRRQASPSLRAEVIDLQAAIAADDSLLPSVEPDSGLRARVLAGIADAIDARRREGLTPLASIGSTAVPHSDVAPPHAHQPRRSTRRDDDEAVAATLLSAARESNTDSLVTRWRSSALFWRAASVALGASLLVVLLANYSLTNRVSHISELALGSATRADLSAVTGPALAQTLQGDAIVRGMVAGQSMNAAGIVLKSPLAQSGLLVTMNLSPRASYDVVVRTGADSWTIRSGFTPSDAIDSIALDFSVANLGTGSTISVLDRETGEVVLTAEI